MSKRILIVGTSPALTTGYAKVVHNLLLHMDPLVEGKATLYLYALQHGGGGHVRTPEYKNCVIHDAQAAEKAQGWGFGMEELAEYVQKVDPHVVFLYNDVYVTHHYIQRLQRVRKNRRIVLYLDMFYKNFYSKYVPALGLVDHIMVFSDIWKEHLVKDLGVETPVEVLYHGCEGNDYPTVSKTEARAALGLPQNAYIVLNMNRNLTRKRLDITIMAWAQLVATHPEEPMLLICNSNKEDGFDVYDIFKQELRVCGLDYEAHKDKVVMNIQAQPDKTVGLMYLASDVGLNTCEGEGAGLCQMEHAALGRPQVLSDVGGLHDMFDPSFSIKVKPHGAYYLDRLTRDAIGGKAEVVDPRDVCLGLEYYLVNPAIRELHGQKARHHFQTTDKYSWPRIAGQLWASLEAQMKNIEQ